MVGAFSGVFLFILRGFEFRIKSLLQPLEQLIKTLPLVNVLEVKRFGNLGSLSENTTFVGFAVVEVIYLFRL